MEQIPDYNLFMMCENLNEDALAAMPDGFYTRLCRKDELDIWKTIHFDSDADAKEYCSFMTKYFEENYEKKADVFWNSCLFVCNQSDTPVGTCFSWKAYESITTIHWYKIIKAYEDKGLGRALLSEVMSKLKPSDYPIYLHTQPSSYRAIKLYSDFGFSLLRDETIGYRENQLELCLPILKEVMPQKYFTALKFRYAPDSFLEAVKSSTISQF